MTVYEIEDDSDNDLVAGDTGGSARRKKRIVIPNPEQIHSITREEAASEGRTDLEEIAHTRVIKARSTNRKLKLDLRKLAG